MIFLEVCFHVLVEAVVAAPWLVRVPLQPVGVPCVRSILPDRVPTLRCIDVCTYTDTEVCRYVDI